MDVSNSVTYVGFNTGVIFTDVVIILISLLVLYLIIKKDRNYIFCENSIVTSMYNLISVSIFCGIFFIMGNKTDYSEYTQLSDASIIFTGISLFLFLLAIVFIFLAIIKVLCKFLYKILKKIRR